MLRKFLKLLSPDTGEGGDTPANPPAPSTIHETNTLETPPPASPPAATIVVQGERTELERELTDKLAATAFELENANKRIATTEQEKKEREQRINQLEDEQRRLTTPAATSEPTRPAGPKRRRVTVGAFTAEE